MSLQQRFASIPILGYLLKCVHDLVYLPVIRRDLHAETKAAEARVRAALQDYSTQTETQLQQMNGAYQTRISEIEANGLQRYLPDILERLSQQGAQVADLELRLKSIPEGIRAIRRMEADTQASVKGLAARVAEHSTRLDGVAPLLRRIDALEGTLKLHEQSLEQIREASEKLERRLSYLESGATWEPRISALEVNATRQNIGEDALQPIRDDVSSLVAKIRQLESLHLADHTRWGQQWDELARSVRVLMQQVRSHEAHQATAHEELERTIATLNGPIRNGLTYESRS